MKIYFVNGDPLEVTDADRDMIMNAKKDKLLRIGSREFKKHDIKFIGEPCMNDKCHRKEHAHPKDETCDYTYTGACSQCGKSMWKRDCDYSKMKFEKVVCREHSPYGRVPRLKEDATAEERLINGAICGFIAKGFSEEDAINKANECIQSKSGFVADVVKATSNHFN